MFQAPTWFESYLGQTGRRERADDDALLASVSQHMDVFIDEYLRVNAAACGDAPKLTPLGFDPFPDRAK